MLKRIVLYVIKSLYQIRTKKLKHAQHIVEPFLDTPTVIKIKKITFEDKEEMTYNLHVDNYNNFAVSNGLIVHNCIKSHMYALEPLSRLAGKPSTLSGTKSKGKKALIEEKRKARSLKREIIKKQKEKLRQKKREARLLNKKS